MKTNEVTKHPKEIKAEISFEIIGEDEPTKYDKRRERWSTIVPHCLHHLCHGRRIGNIIVTIL